ncbi:MAG TPA: hypothetical protein VMJ94_04980 [Nitrososphaera sp.]|nr:hypothetical protein [Nitrososphaera sp.]
MVRKPYQVREATPTNSRGISTCTHCGNKATEEALFKGDGIIVIEKYCEDCLKTETFTAIMMFYERNEKEGAYCHVAARQ